MDDQERKKRETELFKLWVSYTPEKREEQLREMREIAEAIKNHPVHVDFGKLPAFENLIDELEDWHNELADH